MKFREQILAVVGQPDYRPQTESDLLRQLGLEKAVRRRAAHDLRLMLSRGELTLVNGDRVAPIFSPTRRTSARPVPAREPSAPAPAPAPAPRRQRSRRPASPEAAAAAPREDRGRRDESRPAKAKGKGKSAPSATGGDDLVLGKLQFRAGGSAFLLPDPEAGQPAPDSIQIASEDTGLAFHGDRVKVRLLARSTRPPRRGRENEASGRVLEVIERGKAEIVGTLQRIRSRFFVTPDDPRFVHEIAVGDPAASKLKPTPEIGDKVVAELHDWTDRHQPPEGRLIERLGRTWEPRAELLGVYRKFNLDPKFPAEVEREVRSLPSHVPAEDTTGRLDYRAIPTFTIDPDDAKDFDDALSYESLGDGSVKIGIHIADVSAYVKPGTALDKEAQKRGNSTYLVGTVVPMLPEKLSNGLCSLVEGEDRLTKAVFLTFDLKGRLTDTAFGNTVIRSRKRLTYKQAYALLFQNDLEKIRQLPLPPKHQTGSTGRALHTLSDLELLDLQNWIRKLWALASRLRRDRMKHGSLDLDMPETKVFVDEQGYADRLEKIEHDESHQLIEEFMLAANEAVARLTKVSRLPSVYRVHDEPDPDKLDELRENLAIAGIQCGDLTQRSEMTRVLAELQAHPQGHMLRIQLLRSLKKAAYRSSPDGHYGLAKRDYTHFTSPIRRYSDLAVHRVFEFYLIKHNGWPKPPGYKFPYDAAKMTALGEHLSLTEVNSAEAERESVKIKTLEYFERLLEKKTRTNFPAIITDVRPHGLFVELEQSMTFGFVPAGQLGNDYYSTVDDGTALVGRRTKQRFTLGGKIDVQVAKVDRAKRMIDFKLA